MSDRPDDQDSRDLRALDRRLVALEERMETMKAGNRTLEANLALSIERLQTVITEREGNRDTEMARLDTKMAELGTKMAKRETWFLGTVITGFVILGVIVTIFGVRDTPQAPPPAFPAVTINNAPPPEARSAPTVAPEAAPEAGNPVAPEN